MKLDTNPRAILEYLFAGMWPERSGMVGGAGMYFNVSQLMQEPSGSCRTLKLDEGLVAEGAEVQQVTGTIDLVRTDAGIWASVALDAEVLCTCSRCLAECRQRLQVTIEEEFLPIADAETRARVGGLDEATGSSGIDQNNMLDLTEAVSQYYALNMPMKPVCRADCRGICLTCGAELNNFRCKCDNSARDTAWGSLLELGLSNKSTEV